MVSPRWSMIVVVAGCGGVQVWGRGDVRAVWAGTEDLAGPCGRRPPGRLDPSTCLAVPTQGRNMVGVGSRCRRRECRGSEE